MEGAAQSRCVAPPLTYSLKQGKETDGFHCATSRDDVCFLCGDEGNETSRPGRAAPTRDGVTRRKWDLVVKFSALLGAVTGEQPSPVGSLSVTGCSGLFWRPSSSQKSG